MDPEPSHEQPKQEQALDLNFVPTWAREPAGRNPYADFRGGGGEREGRRERRGGERAPRDRRDRGPRPERPAGERREGRGPGRGPGFGGPGRGPGGPRRGPRGAGPRTDYTPRPEPVPVDIRFLPERSRLGAVVHDLQVSGRAHPLADLAVRFLSNPAFYAVRLEARDPAHKARLFQCKECGIVFLEKDVLLSHITSAHLEKFFDKQTLQVDPPSGNFTCVARCRLSGVLLGPPNYHGYNEKVQELWRTRYPHMTLDEYRGRIETARDPALIEKWKEECRTRTIYRLRGQEPPVDLKRAEAEKHCAEHCAPPLVGEASKVIVPADVALKFEDARLRRAVREAWENESRRPFSLMLALRAAFHHMHLHLFRANRQVTFVTRIEPRPVAPGQAVEAIAEVLQFLKDHPGCTRQALVEKLRPGAAPESVDVARVISPLGWLIERGHVIEFFDGTLSLPGARPAAAR